MKYLANVTTLDYTHEKCAGCGTLRRSLPRGVFVMRDKRVAVTDKDLCTECGACAKNCDFGASRECRCGMRISCH